ncbi:hypothetical protein Htur_5073 (plasmid) [Haloterrigena turkmenica DSM 5511]|uniref:Uncharacterized protein n=1 Tax=Haloterrigena turkmenica (strain ATCC 51198 / DSM 5511 / JCM 9101 / NCIMB 13204 / VKM B-1734 / 4k) TaxID=543526 RepID=D2S3L3_HALTV|nr:hypothetical protein [Haloterrigena turkmenica]ADB63960.1 hypothetical protein Htur_5073 [Haloterrigena turkmenica DSM 5511]
MRKRLRTWWRRRKLERGYQKIAEADLGKSVGFTPIMRKWELMERDGYIELEDGEKRWLWP